MKALSILLIIAAFLVGSFLSVLDPVTVQWQWMIPALAVGAVGLIIHRRAAHSEASDDQRLSGNIQTLSVSLQNILANLEEMAQRKDDLPTYEARFEIDRLFREDLDNFAEARESIIHVYGIRHYADVMSNFAAGERYINRVWSASTDGYVDEVTTYIERARNQFREADRHFKSLAQIPSDKPAITQSD